MVRISHREYLGDVLVSATPGAFKNDSLYSLNPGQSQTFPWLSTIAGNYLEYMIHNLAFLFVSTSATALNSTNTQLGIVAMRAQYDPTFAADTSLIQMENAFDCHKANPSVTQTYHCGGIKGGLRTVRTGAQPSNTDLRMYDEGFMQIATQGMQAAGTNIGQLWVVYDIELVKEVYVQGQVGNTIRSAHYRSSTFSPSSPLGLAGSIPAQGTDFIGLTVTNTTITFPNTISTGDYYITVQWVGSIAGNYTAPSLTLTNCAASTPNAIWGSGASTTQSAPENGAACTSCMMGFQISVNAPGSLAASVVFGTGGVFPTGASSVNTYVVQCNPLTN